MKPVKTWILVTDGSGMRVFLNDGPGHGVKELKELARDNDLKSSGEIDSDRPGRVFDSGGEGRHAMEPPTDAKDHERQMFAKEIADALAEAERNKAFERLIIVSPPKSLGELRAVLSKQVADKVTAELAKDFTHLNADELAGHLGDVLAV